jgi:hypothetical protein
LLLLAAAAQILVLACGLEPRGPEGKAQHGVPGGRVE